MMKASENGYIQRYINEVCYPIDYAEVQLGALLNTTEGKYRFANTFDNVNPTVAHTDTRALVRTDRSPLSYPLDSILLDVHSKGRANRKYENSSTQEVDKVGYKVLDNNDFIPKIIEALDTANLDCTNVQVVENINSPNRSATWGTLILKDHPIDIKLPNGKTSTQYPTIDWTNSYDKTFSARLWAGLYGGICLNRQIFSGWAIMQYTHKHIKRKNGSSGVDMDIIQAKIDGVSGTFEAITNQCNSWADTPITEEQAKSILAKTLAWNTQTRQASDRKLEELVNWFSLYEAKNTGLNLWSLYNTATHFATHGNTNDVNTTLSASQLQKLQQSVVFMIQSPQWNYHNRNTHLNSSLV